MKFLVETYTSRHEKKRFWPLRVFTPGWYSDQPHFKISHPSEDYLGTQHLRIYITDGPGCHPAAVGQQIATAHVPEGFVMINKKRHHDLLEAEKKLNEVMQPGYQYNFFE